MAEDRDLAAAGLSGVALRPYQRAGVQWLSTVASTGRGGILADEMGLGKTVQTIATLALVHGAAGAAPPGPSLVVVPLSLMGNWDAELARFAPRLRRRRYTGDRESRAEMQEELERLASTRQLDVLLTTYEMCIKDAAFFVAQRWACLVVDEGHRLKNADAQLYATLRALSTRARILLTGTPVQNNLGELYALLSFVAPSDFPSAGAADFVARNADVEEDAAKAAALHAALRPFLLRRTKGDVAADLPPKEEVVLYTGLTAVQLRLYRALLARDIEALAGDSKARLSNLLVQLRKCVNHPYLFEGIEPEPFAEGEHLVEASAKLALLDRLLVRLRAQGHRVLLFSQMARMLDILQDYASFRGFAFERLDGSVRGDERDAAVRSFQGADGAADDAPWLFLLSTRAGGLGLNLTSADTVIFYDSDFNPQSDLQAAARAHRIGQDRPVKVLRLVTRDTVDEVVVARARRKLRLTRAVIARGQFAGGAVPQGDADPEADELRVILRHGIERILRMAEGGDGGDGAPAAEALDRLVGRTVDGRWVIEAAAQPGAAGIQEGAEEEEAGGEDDGERARADIAAADALIASERARRGAEAGVVRPRREITPEERQRRAEMARKRKLERDAAEQRREEARLRKRRKLWSDSGYVSTSVEGEGEGSSADASEEDEDGLGALHADVEEGAPLEHRVGNVALARGPRGTTTIIAVPVDDSGRWGRGGLFGALSSVSQRPREHYELAGKMGDLALGDAHLVDVQGRTGADGPLLVCLLVVQGRDAHSRLAPIDPVAVDAALAKLGTVARRLGASVHVPRIGHGDPSFSYYRCERLLRKHLCAQGVHTSVYYYRANQPPAQPPSATPSSPPAGPGPAMDDDDDGAGLSNAAGPSGASAPSPFEGVVLCFYKVAAAEAKALARLVGAFGGRAAGRLAPDTTHVVCGDEVDASDDAVQRFKAGQPGICLVGVEWLRRCVARARLLDTAAYAL